ncbi:MAG: hypothetical protein AAFZ15_00855 [Bacteroidota bacterium]
MKLIKKNIIFLASAFLFSIIFSPLVGQEAIIKHANTDDTGDEWKCVGNDCVIIKRGENNSKGFFEIDFELIDPGRTSGQKPVKLITNGNEIISAKNVPKEERQKNRRVEMTIVFELANTATNQVYKYWWKNKKADAETERELSRFCRGTTQIKVYETDGSSIKIYEVTCHDNDGSPRARKIFIGELNFS